jgi:hypothetical protein
MRSSWEVAPQTAAKDMSTVKAFFEFCLANEWIPRNPARLVKNQRTRDSEDRRKPPGHFLVKLRRLRRQVNLWRASLGIHGVEVTSSAGTGDGWILRCALFREPIAQHCGTKQKAPGLRRGLVLI